jgi:hypothetical protein
MLWLRRYNYYMKYSKKSLSFVDKRQTKFSGLNLTRGLIVIILSDLFGGFILPFLNLSLFSKPKVADFFFEFKRQKSAVVFIYKLIEKLV